MSWNVDARLAGGLVDGWLKVKLPNKAPDDRRGDAVEVVGLELGGVSHPCVLLVCTRAGRRALGPGVEGGDETGRIVPPLEAVLVFLLELESEESFPLTTRSPARRLGCQSCRDACSITFWPEPSTKTTWRRCLRSQASVSCGVSTVTGSVENLRHVQIDHLVGSQGLLESEQIGLRAKHQTMHITTIFEHHLQGLPPVRADVLRDESGF